MTATAPAHRAHEDTLLQRWPIRLVVGLLLVASSLLVGGAANRVGSLLGADAITLFVVTNVTVVCYALLAYLLFVRRIERRAATELSGKGAPVSLLWGSPSAARYSFLAIATITFQGGYQIAGSGTIAGAGASLMLAASASVVEELAFRGILLRIVEDRFGTWIAVVVSGILFAALNVLSPAATWLSILAMLLGPGLLFSASFVRFRNLWVPIGMHLGWIWSQGGLFGAPLSGAPSFGLLVGVLQGPVWLTGGAYGPEASVAAVVVALGASALLVYSALRKGTVLHHRTPILR